MPSMMLRSSFARAVTTPRRRTGPVGERRSGGPGHAYLWCQPGVFWAFRTVGSLVLAWGASLSAVALVRLCDTGFTARAWVHAFNYSMGGSQ